MFLTSMMVIPLHQYTKCSFMYALKYNILIFLRTIMIFGKFFITVLSIRYKENCLP